MFSVETANLVHQDVFLDVDLEGRRLGGRTSLYFECNDMLERIYINCEMMSIVEVTCGEQDMEYYYPSQEEDLIPLGNADDGKVKVFDMVWVADQYESEKGRLVCRVDPEMWVENTPAARREVLGRQNYQPGGMDEEMKYLLRAPISILYVLHDPAHHSILFADPEDRIYRKDSGLYAIGHNAGDGVRYWLPTHDAQDQMCTLSMNIEVDDRSVAVCSGELVGKAFNEAGDRMIYMFQCQHPVSMREICFVVGRFAIIPDKSVSKVCYFGPSSVEGHIVNNMVPHMKDVFAFTEACIGTPYPYEMLNIVIVDAPLPHDMIHAINMTVCSFDTLYSKDDIEGQMEGIPQLGYMIARQWYGNAVRMNTYLDEWLKYGLAGYVAHEIRIHMFGVNHDIALNMQLMDKLIDDCIRGGEQPLASPLLHICMRDYRILRKKSPLIIRMIENHTGKDLFRKVLMKLSDYGGKGNSTVIDTEALFGTVKTISGVDLRSREAHWISNSVYPNVRANFWYNEKGNEVEVILREDSLPPHSITCAAQPITLRIKEDEGIYDHVLPWDDDIQSFKIVCSTKRNRKRKRDEDVGEGAPSVEAPIHWLQLDPDFLLISRIHMVQPFTFWCNQLTESRSIVSMNGALWALGRDFPKKETLVVMKQILYNDALYWSVRSSAALGIALIVTRSSDWEGLDILRAYFQSRYCDGSIMKIKPIDPSDLSAYNLLKGLVNAIACIKDKAGVTPIDVIDLLYRLLLVAQQPSFHEVHHTDSLLCTILSSLSQIKVTQSAETVEKIYGEILQLIEKEKVLPSTRHRVFCTAIMAVYWLQRYRILPLDLAWMAAFVDRKYYYRVRQVGLYCLLRLGDFSDPLVLHHFLAAIVDEDDSRVTGYLGTIWKDCSEDHRRTIMQPLQKYPHFCLALWKYMNDPLSNCHPISRIVARNIYELIWGNAPGGVGTAPAYPSIQKHMRSDEVEFDVGKAMLEPNLPNITKLKEWSGLKEERDDKDDDDMDMNPDYQEEEPEIKAPSFSFNMKNLDVVGKQKEVKDTSTKLKISFSLKP